MRLLCCGHSDGRFPDLPLALFVKQTCRLTDSQVSFVFCFAHFRLVYTHQAYRLSLHDRIRRFLDQGYANSVRNGESLTMRGPLK